jgi:hypothetical protein
MVLDMGDLIVNLLDDASMMAEKFGVFVDKRQPAS